VYRSRITLIQNRNPGPLGPDLYSQALIANWGTKEKKVSEPAVHDLSP